MKKKFYLFMILPCFMLVSIFLILPLIIKLFPTFIENNTFTFSKYLSFFNDNLNKTIFLRSIKLSIISTIICIILGLPTSYFIVKQKKNVKSLLLSIILFPLLINSVVRGFAWINILGKTGLINQILLKLHIIDTPLKLLYTDVAIVIGSVYLFLPLMITTVTSVMDKIEDETIEAAMSLGANGFVTFLKVILPLSFSGILTGSILVFSGVMSAYTTPKLLGGNKKMILATLLYEKASVIGDWNSASIIAFIMIVLTFSVMKLLNYISKKVDKRC